MAYRMLMIFWCILALQHSVAASFNLTVQPAEIASGLTKSLIINCSFFFESPSNFSGLLSLIISKSDEKNNESQTFQELVSFNAFTGDQVNILSHLTAVVSGHIGISDNSFISLQWTYPSANEGGLYRCGAHGVDSTGHPTDVSAIVQVPAQEPDLNQVISALRVLDYTVQELHGKQKHQESKETAMLAALFKKSEEYNDRYYLLSRQYFNRADVAEVICEQHGGYLAEIDNYAEYRFIREFIISLSDYDITHVLLGATDEAQEGHWMHRFSRKPLLYTKWAPGRPIAPGAPLTNDCMVLYRNYQWLMADNNCGDRPDTPKRHYLCEVPIY